MSKKLKLLITELIDNDNKEKGVDQTPIVSDDKGDENNGDAVERGVNKNNIDDNNNNGEGVSRGLPNNKDNR